MILKGFLSIYVLSVYISSFIIALNTTKLGMYTLHDQRKTYLAGNVFLQTFTTKVLSQ
jgi:hypothetical protein